MAQKAQALLLSLMETGTVSETKFIRKSSEAFRDILKEVGEQERIDLFLYSRGGELTTPLPIVHLIKSHCKKFNILIPYKAHSAAILICLGADEIVMGEMGQLSPIDPTTYNVFNPLILVILLE